jgi:hypothetical protein
MHACVGWLHSRIEQIRGARQAGSRSHTFYISLSAAGSFYAFSFSVGLRPFGQNSHIQGLRPTHGLFGIGKTHCLAFVPGFIHIATPLPVVCLRTEVQACRSPWSGTFLFGSFKFVFPGIGRGSRWAPRWQNRDFPTWKPGGFQIHGPATVLTRNMRNRALLLLFHFTDCRPCLFIFSNRQFAPNQQTAFMPDNQLSLPGRRLLTVTFQQGLDTRRDSAALTARISIRCHHVIPRLPPAVVIILTTSEIT